eukprot:TRINITY_DN37291_c0_g1_i1.p1 TRINITY_DN37291_c0_g1~~TRINITY_DN37291_c0_g1_i1.p1  ORF type:complete len:763 (-),score=196.55 TRINITY_DN37291_c0_g1_i1:106-2211(-)
MASAVDGASVDLTANDVAALERARERLQADPSLLYAPELGFFRDLVKSLGGTVAANGGSSDAKASGPNGAAPAKAEATVMELDSGDEEEPAAKAKEPAAKAGVMELESDEEDRKAAPQEMELPLGDLDDELEPEVHRGGDPDPELLPKDRPPYPTLPPQTRSEPSDARRRVLEKVKKQAAAALEEGNLSKAVERYTHALKTGDATATMLATRAALLLQLRRPCAAIRDCCAAMQLNRNCAKAWSVRGLAHRRLGHYRKAHRDLSHGQKLDFSEEYVAAHEFVARRIGIRQDAKTGEWLHWEGKDGANPKKAVAALFGEDAPTRKANVPVRSDLRVGQAVRIDGLQKAPQLNGKRGVILRLDPSGNGRWEVELRLDAGRVETKSLQGKNIFTVKASDAGPWRREEQKHAEERKKREGEEQKWRDEQAKKRKLEEEKREKSKLQADGFPDMDPAELLEAEMSSLPLDREALTLLRRLAPDTALGIVRQGNLGSIAKEELSSYVSLKARRLLGEDSDDEPKPVNFGNRSGAPAAAQTAPAQDPSLEYDPELLEAETEPFPAAPSEVAGELSSEQASLLENWRREAAEANEDGDTEKALRKLTDVLVNGGASALVLSKRAEILLKRRRPKAALEDCNAALRLNPDTAKALRVRGLVHRRLGKWREAASDLTEAQRVDFDEDTAALQRLCSEKAKAIEAFEASKRR